MKSRARILFAAAALPVCAAFGASPSAYAAPPSAATPAAPPTLEKTLTGEAKTQWEAGRTLYIAANKPSDYTSALANFRRAYELQPDPRLFWSIAACEKELGDRPASFEAAHRYLDEGASLLTEKEKKQGADLIAVLSPYVSTLTIQTSEDGIALSVDDKPVGTSPIAKPLYVDIGHRVLHASKAGEKTLDMPFEGIGGGAIVMTVLMQPELHQGRLVIDVSDQALVQVDKKTVGYGQVDVPMASGVHSVHLSAKGKQARDIDNVVIKDNEPVTLHVILEDTPSSVPAWVWIAGGVVVAGGLTVAGIEIFKPSDKQGAAPTGTLGNAIANQAFRFR